MTWGTDGVSVRFGGRLALDRVSVSAEPGEVTGVVGGDGAGKSTLLRLLAGALRPTSGTVSRPHARRTGYLASTSGTYPDLSVQENLDFVAAAYGVARADARARASSYLERTGLAPFATRLAGELSGGMRHKLGVVAALLHRPELLVLDEPTTGVDPVSRADVWWLIATAAAEGAAVVVSTTYIDEAERAVRLLVLDGGRELAAGTPDDVRDAVPGSIRTVHERPTGAAAARCWRRGTSFRVWEPDRPAPGMEPFDLHDAVVALALGRTLDGTG